MSHRRRVAAAVVALIAVASVPACSRNHGPKAGEAQLEVDGTAVVTSPNGQRLTVTSGRTVHDGDKVEVTQGTGKLQLPGTLRLELRAGVGGHDNSAVTVATVPVLDAGDLLTTANDERRVSAAGTVVTVSDGSARVSRFLGMAVATYGGVVSLDSAGQVRTVPALRQMQVPTLGRPPQAVTPLVYSASDLWDRRFLGEAIDFGERLQRFAISYTASLTPGQGRTPGFFKLVLPALANEREFTAGLMGTTRVPGETLVGAAIASLGSRGTFTQRWNAIFQFRAEGAAWGLVALDQGVSGGPLLSTVEQALNASSTAFQFNQAASTPGASTSTTSPGSGPTTSTTAPPPTTTTTAPTTPPTTNPLSPVVDPVNNLLGGLLNSLIGGP
jgi:hypothetical protein